MPGRDGRSVWVKVLTSEEKADITAVCERFIADTLKPRFLPEVAHASVDHPVRFSGKWRGSRYSFLAHYRSGSPDDPGEAFSLAFARLDHVEDRLAEVRFDVMWHRHTGQWFRRHAAVTLPEALQVIEKDGLLHPVV